MQMRIMSTSDITQQCIRYAAQRVARLDALMRANRLGHYTTKGSCVMAANRMKCGVFVLGLAAAIFSSHFISFAGEIEKPTWADDLNRLAQYLGRPVAPDKLGAIETAHRSVRPEIRALAAALLYRADPVKWGSELSAAFSIHDYAARSRGEVHNIGLEEFISITKDLELRCPWLDKRLVPLVAFVHFQNANIWFPHGDKSVSAARFFRGMFLAEVFEDSQANALTVANHLDQKARQEFDLGQKRKQ